MGPYLKRTPRNWFLPLTGPKKSRPEGKALLETLALEDVKERPRTIPENHEVDDVVVDEEEEEDEFDVEDKEEEETE